MYHKAVSSYCVTYAWLHTGSLRIYLLLISYLISELPRGNTLRVSPFLYIVCINKSGPQSKGFKVYIALTCPQAGILIETKREFNKTKCDPYNVEAIRTPVQIIIDQLGQSDYFDC